MIIVLNTIFISIHIWQISGKKKRPQGRSSSSLILNYFFKQWFVDDGVVDDVLRHLFTWTALAA